MNRTERRLILALETGIDGGSVAILDGKRVLCSAEGTGGVSKSEDLLLMVEELLELHGVEKQKIGLIAVSDRPGSATGIRIGLATAIGLGDALAAKVYQSSILKAQIAETGAETQIISAVYSEKNGIYYQKYRESGGTYSAETEILNERAAPAFIELMKTEMCLWILDKKLGLKLQDEQYFKTTSHYMASSRAKFRIMQENHAESIGFAAGIASDNIEN